MTSLQQWLGSRGILLKSFLECVWGYVWARNQASEEVVVGTVDWGRPAGFENTVGLFENIIPVRFEVRKHAVDSGVIEDLLPQLEYFYSFPDVRFESLLEVNKSSAWFHSMIVVFPQGINRITVDPDFWVDPLIVENSTAKIPYLLQVFEEDNRLATRLEVSTDVYVAEKAKNILDSFVETINLLIK
jgi:non-ribosomal peptide synthetase component F